MEKLSKETDFLKTFLDTFPGISTFIIAETTKGILGEFFRRTNEKISDVNLGKMLVENLEEF